MIPDSPLRQDALGALDSKRTHIAGAALFWTLPKHRDLRLLRLLVAYEIILEFLDNAHERAANEANGHQLHRALIEALNPSAPISDYYRNHPWKNDAGYLRALVETCREGCLLLPSYQGVRWLVLRGARRCGDAQSLNHEASRHPSGDALKAWAEIEFPGEQESRWWELSAAASSSVGVHALLALAACSPREDYAQVNAAYVPWICALSTMLDSYVDQSRDHAAGQHSYLDYYPSPEIAVCRIRELIRRSTREASGLRDGQRHVLIIAGMVAMYLSADDARVPSARTATASLIEAGGSITRMLVPMLRLWRLAYGQRSA